MYLRKVCLRNWGCHDELAVEFGPGLNVCVGPNGAGKSTLYQAILTALTVKHNSKSKEMAHCASWGKEGFGPSAALEIVRGDGAWRLSKSYLYEAICTLERELHGKRESMKNQQAEQVLGGWLESDGAAGRLMLALWSAQNASMQVFDNEVSPETRARASLLEQVIARAGRPEASGPFAQVKRAVAKHYEEIFTPAKKEIKTGSELDRARKSLVDAEARLEELRQKREELEAKIAAHAERSARHEQDCRAPRRPPPRARGPGAPERRVPRAGRGPEPGQAAGRRAAPAAPATGG